MHTQTPCNAPGIQEVHEARVMLAVIVNVIMLILIIILITILITLLIIVIPIIILIIGSWGSESARSACGCALLYYTTLHYNILYYTIY